MKKWKSESEKECKSERVQERKSARVKECKSARVQEWKSACVQECMCSWVVALIGEQRSGTRFGRRGRASLCGLSLAIRTVVIIDGYAIIDNNVVPHGILEETEHEQALGCNLAIRRHFQVSCMAFGGLGGR